MKGKTSEEMKVKGWTKLDQARYLHKLTRGSLTPNDKRPPLSALRKSLENPLPQELVNVLKLEELWRSIKRNANNSLTLNQSVIVHKTPKLFSSFAIESPSQQKMCNRSFRTTTTLGNSSTSSIFYGRNSLHDTLKPIEEATVGSTLKHHASHGVHYDTAQKRSITPKVGGTVNKSKTLLEKAMEYSKGKDATAILQQKVWKAMADQKGKATPMPMSTKNVVKKEEAERKTGKADKDMVELSKTYGKKAIPKVYSTTTGIGVIKSKLEKSQSTKKERPRYNHVTKHTTNTQTAIPKPTIQRTAPKNPPERQCVTPNKLPSNTSIKNRETSSKTSGLCATFISNRAESSPFKKKGSIAKVNAESTRNAATPKLGIKASGTVASKTPKGKPESILKVIPSSTKAVRQKESKDATVRKLMNRININSLITKLCKPSHKI